MNKIDANLLRETEEFVSALLEDKLSEIDSMRQESRNLTGEKISKQKFHKISLKFFQRHECLTDYARKELQPKKEKIFEL